MEIKRIFGKFKAEGALIGTLLAGYADLEIALLFCAQVVREDMDGVLKAMFRSRGNRTRIDIAEGLARPKYRDVGLEEQFAAAVSAMGYCLSLRNQYAHCLWHDDKTGKLGFTNLEDLAGKKDVVLDLGKAEILHVDVDLLTRQLDYFAYADLMLNWTNFEGRVRAGKLKENPHGKAPAVLKQPAKAS